MSLIARIPSLLFIVAVPLFLVTASVTWAFNSPGVYHGGFERYDVSRITGITDGDLGQVAADIRSYFNSPNTPLEVRTRVFGVEKELFNQREIGHMRDVKRLVWGVYIIGAVTSLYLLAVVSIGLVRYRRQYAEILARRLLWGGSLTIVLIAGVGLFALVGFDTLFLKFHQLSFANELWQLDSRNDFLVMLFPQDFWFDATMWVATRALTAALIIGVVAGAYLLYLRRWTHKSSEGSLGQLGSRLGP